MGIKFFGFYELTFVPLAGPFHSITSFSNIPPIITTISGFVKSYPCLQV